jgi:NADPH:quinone reductase-like Zn-dependent oxidoreductase
MKAAIVMAKGAVPVYGDFEMPVAKDGEVLVRVKAAALSNLTRGRASGSHYSADGIFPAVAGTDGVGLAPDGRRVYFAMPEAPFGTMAEYCPIHVRRMVEIPEGVEDVMAAAIANPGMSAWAALMERAHLAPGETVLVNGATGTAGKVAVQLAKYLGAGKVIATGRNAAELATVGADAVIPFALGEAEGAKQFEESLAQMFAGGIDVVIDYLWGDSAKTIITAIAKTVEDHPVRFVQVGTVSDAEILLPGAALRSSALTLMGSGIGSVSREGLLQSIRGVFEAVVPAGMKVETAVVPLSEVESVWAKSTGKPRVVFSIG